MFLTQLRKFTWRHSLRSEHNVTEGVGRVEPPLFGQQAPFRLEPVVDVRSRERHKMVEGGEEELVAQRELVDDPERLRRIVVIAEHERGINGDVVAAQVGDGARIVGANPVDVLAHLPESFKRKRLEADENALASTPVEQVKRLLVVRHVKPELRDPPTLQWCHGPAKRLQPRDVHGKVVIDEEEVPALQRPHFGDDVLNRPRRVRTAEELAD